MCVVVQVVVKEVKGGLPCRTATATPFPLASPRPRCSHTATVPVRSERMMRPSIRKKERERKKKERKRKRQITAAARCPGLPHRPKTTGLGRGCGRGDSAPGVLPTRTGVEQLAPWRALRALTSRRHGQHQAAAKRSRFRCRPSLRHRPHPHGPPCSCRPSLRRWTP